MGSELNATFDTLCLFQIQVILSIYKLILCWVLCIHANAFFDCDILCCVNVLSTLSNILCVTSFITSKLSIGSKSNFLNWVLMEDCPVMTRSVCHQINWMWRIYDWINLYIHLWFSNFWKICVIHVMTLR